MILECLQENKNSSIKINFCQFTKKNSIFLNQKLPIFPIFKFSKYFSSFFLFWVVLPTLFALSAQAAGVRKLPPVAPAQIAYTFSSSQDENIILENCASKANSPKPRVSLVLSVESGANFSRGYTLKISQTIETKTVHTVETQPQVKKSGQFILSNIPPLQKKGKTKQKAHDFGESSRISHSPLKSLKYAIQENYEPVRLELTRLSANHRQ